MTRFEGKTVFITGGARGMGLTTGAAFAAEGASVFLFDLDAEQLPRALDQIGGAARGATGDVRTRADVERALAECEHELGPVNILLNHAGIGPSTHTLDVTEGEWDEVIGTNLTGIFVVGQIVARSMAERGDGVIVNMSSSGGIAAEPGHVHYAGSKAAILALTRAMAHDLAPLGIRVCTLCPGNVAVQKKPNVEWERKYDLAIAAGRSGRPEEISAVYLYLASDDARHLHGAALIVDGGMLAWE